MYICAPEKTGLHCPVFSRRRVVMYLATRSGVKLTGIKKALVVSNKFSKPNSAGDSV